MSTLFWILATAIAAAFFAFRHGYAKGVDDGYDEGFTDAHSQRCIPASPDLDAGIHKRLVITKGTGTDKP